VTVLSDDLLGSASWECLSTEPDAIADPSELDGIVDGWLPASVPGTAAAAVREADGAKPALAIAYDDRDWWFRCRFTVPSSGRTSECWMLRLHGLATLADVWLNGVHVLHSEAMFRAHDIQVADLSADNALVIRFAALAPALRTRRPRPRWRTRLVREQNLRWFRTTLLGRMPGWSGFAAPVGPWRPVTLTPRPRFDVVRQHLVASVQEGGAGAVDIRVALRGVDSSVPSSAELHVGDVSAGLEIEPAEDGFVVRGRLEVAEAKLWWPHSHGDQPRYPAFLIVDGVQMALGHIGFRTVRVDRSSGGFAVVVNGTAVFCRGVCWVSPDVVSLNPSESALRAALEQLRAAGLNMVRVTGTMVYESPEFWDLCDELGIMVWQDAMFATLDIPDDAALMAEIETELHQAFTQMQGHPSATVICGGSETEQQATFVGLAPDRRRLSLFEKTVADLVEELLPKLPYITSSPGGSEPPILVAEGVSHYFGVGAYLRPLSDAATANVRFAAECLAFSAPPESATVDEAFGSPALAGHHPDWKAAVPRDNSASWDFEDVRDFYVRQLFEIDLFAVRYTDPERALDLGRAALAHIFGTTYGGWRRAGSGCGGALVLAGRDLLPGAGWGIVDALGRPKSTWYALRRIMQPTCVLFDDRGLDGISVYVINESPRQVEGSLTIDVFDRLGNCTDLWTMAVTVEARETWSIALETVFDGFRDFNYAYRFGTPTYDVVHAAFVVDDRSFEAVHLPLGQARPTETEIGLRATAVGDSGGWALEVSTERFAQWVAIDVAGFVPEDSWFHLAPGKSRRVRLDRVGDGHSEPVGYVRALNAHRPAAVLVAPSTPAGETEVEVHR
jgi:beta-mannosidase